MKGTVQKLLEIREKQVKNQKNQEDSNDKERGWYAVCSE